MQVIVFPTGDRIGFDNVHSYKVKGSSVEFTMDNGQVRSMLTSSPSSASYFVTQIDTLPATTTATQVTLVLKEPYIITSIEVPFTLLDTLITIHGSGFTQADVGVLWIEDSTGGMDYNTDSCYCQVIDSNTMRCWWKDWGDDYIRTNAPQTNCSIQYKDANGVVSNIVSGFNTNNGYTFTNP